LTEKLCMNFFVLISLILSALYVAKILYYKRSWERYSEFKTGKEPVNTGISVVIAFRNEKENLPLLFASLEKQIYPADLYEVILVDDHSDDGSVEYIKEYIITDPKFKLYSNKISESGKKAALLKGIGASSFELIVTTDADCVMGNRWLATVAEFYQINHPAMIIGLVDNSGDKGFFNKFREIEFMSLVAAGAGAAAGGKPVYCSGTNLAYEKDVFLSYDDPLKKTAVSGDDTLFLLSIKKDMKKRIMLLKSVSAIVHTVGVSSWSQFFNQRKRWISKARYYKDPEVIYTAWLVLLESVMMIYSLGLFIAGIKQWLFPFIFIAKILVDFLFMKSIMKYFNKNPFIINFTAYSMIYPVYLLAVVCSGIFFRYTWKGRHYDING
jgi:cellulose synthase/poly-beta-1,6-N-acetylglucosamine synthase-like glycosyltransferase